MFESASKPKGIIALPFCTYHHDIEVNDKVESIYQDFYQTIRPYFPKGREHVDNYYKNITINLPRLDS